MIRINLLPPEIIERRKYDRFYPYVFLISGVIIAVVVVSWGALQYLASLRNAELQRMEQELVSLQQRAEGLKVFELKEQELQARQKTATDALAGRVDLGRIAEEISLVLPDEVWVTRLNLGEMDGIDSELHTPRPLGQTVSDGFKSAASTLVELGSLETLSDVWLTEATVEDFSGFQGNVSAADKLSTLGFRLTAKIATSTVAPAGR